VGRKAIASALAFALIAAGAAQGSTLSHVWIGKTSRGGNMSFLRAGNRIHRVLAEVNVTCINNVESTRRDTTEQLGFDRIVKVTRGGRINTTKRYSSSFVSWTLTLTGTVSATKARGRISWTYENSSAGYSCRGRGSSRWTARRDRAVADPF
jgi:hypothetical protein